MLPALARHHNNQAGFVILCSVANDLKCLTVEWVIWVFYCDGLLRIVGIMRLFPGLAHVYQSFAKGLEHATLRRIVNHRYLAKESDD